MNMLILKQKLKIKTNLKLLSGIVAVCAILVGASIYSAWVRADQFDDQINALQQQNNANQAVSNQLAAQASSYQDAVDKLDSQINSLQQAIVASQQRSDDLQKQIDAEQAELDHQRQVLSTNIKTMYLEGQISTLEILASSQDLSDFVNKEQYRNAVAAKIKTALDKINALKVQLTAQKHEVDELIKTQESQRNELATAEAYQSRMLSYTEGQKSAYDQQIKNNQSKIGELRRAQAIANSRFNIGGLVAGDPNHGGYPSVWANAPQDSMIDYWGMYNRECVSYTAWRVHQDYMAGKTNRDMPYWGGAGNANQWDDDARAAGIPVDFNPTPGSIAISNTGTWGHAMYVEAVSGNTIYVSQYNASLDGQYSEAWRYTTGLVFLHF